MRSGTRSGLTSQSGKVRKIEFPPDIRVTEPEPDPPTGDETAFRLYATTLPETYHEHSYRDNTGSTYYANYGPGHPAYVSASNYATPIVGNMTENIGLKRLVPRGEATHVAVRDGAWDDPNTWYEDEVPGAGARVLISRSTHVTYSIVSNTVLDWVRVDGKFTVNPAVNTKMVADFIYVDTGGEFREGSVTNPVAADKTHLWEYPVTTDLDVDRDPLLMGRGFVSEGLLEICGAIKVPFRQPLNRHPQVGDTTILLDGEPTGWRVGDTVLITSTRLTRPSTQVALQHTNYNEERVIQSISGNTITLTTPLSFEHVGGYRGFEPANTMLSPRGNTQACFVANLTRNIKHYVVEGGTWPTVAMHRRPHIMFAHTPWIDVRYVWFDGLGRTRKDIRSFRTTATTTYPLDSGTPITVVPHTASSNVQGRYALHLHRAGYGMEMDGCPVTGDIICACNKAMIKGCSITRSGAWAAAHHSSNAILEENVAYLWNAAGFVSELPVDSGEWLNNLSASGMNAVATQGETKHGDSGGDFDGNAYANDPARRNTCFWIAGRNIACEGNIAIDGVAGHTWNMRHDKFLGPPVSFTPIPELFGTFTSGETASIQGDKIIIRRAKNLHAAACRVGFMAIKVQPDQFHHLRTIVKNFHGYELYTGTLTEYTSRYTFLDLDITNSNFDRQQSAGVNILQASANMVFARPYVRGFPTGIFIWPRPEFTLQHGHVIVDPTYVSCTRRLTQDSVNNPDIWDSVVAGSFSTVAKFVTQSSLTPNRLTFIRSDNLVPFKENDPFFRNPIYEPEAPLSSWPVHYFKGSFTDSWHTEDLVYHRNRAVLPIPWRTSEIELGAMKDWSTFEAELRSHGYWTHTGGVKVGKALMLVSDQISGDFMRFYMPFNLSPFNTTGWTNNGPLPADLEAKFVTGATWVAGVDAPLETHEQAIF